MKQLTPTSRLVPARCIGPAARRLSLSAMAVVTAALVGGCSSGSDASKTDTDFEQEVVTGMHDSLLADLDGLVLAARDLQAAAPVTSGRGWDATEDAEAIASMKAAWIRARSAYEHVEGALAPIFPDVDASIDARYDDFLAGLGDAGDADLFDDQGVTGLHAVERILYAPTTPAHVVTFEASLPGYKAAAWPATEQEASDFKDKLAAKLVADAQLLHDQWTPQKIDIGGAFQGLISLMNEQREKVNKASTNEEESRYAQRTLADLRDNLEGTKKIYAIFQPWLVTKANPADPADDGKHADAAIGDGFVALESLYAQVPGDAIPAPPATWSAESPSAEDLSTPFGALYTGVRAAVDPTRDGSVVDEMNTAAKILGFPEFVEE